MLDTLYKFYSSCQKHHCYCECSSTCVSLLLPALATVMRMMRKKPTVQTAATGSTTAISMPKTNAKEIIMVRTSNISFLMKTTQKTLITFLSYRSRSRATVMKKQELTGMRSVWHFNPDGSIRQEALVGGVSPYCFSLSDRITVLQIK